MAPYALPTLNTLMTCSVYTTVAVAIDRYIEMTDSLRKHKWLKNGKIHCFVVAIFSIIFNISRWFELEYVYHFEPTNVTNTNQSNEVVTKNISKIILKVINTRGMVKDPTCD